MFAILISGWIVVFRSLFRSSTTRSKICTSFPGLQPCRLPYTMTKALHRSFGNGPGTRTMTETQSVLIRTKIFWPPSPKMKCCHPKHPLQWRAFRPTDPLCEGRLRYHALFCQPILTHHRRHLSPARTQRLLPARARTPGLRSVCGSSNL